MPLVKKRTPRERAEGGQIVVVLDLRRVLLPPEQAAGDVVDEGVAEGGSSKHLAPRSCAAVITCFCSLIGSVQSGPLKIVSVPPEVQLVPVYVYPCSAPPLVSAWQPPPVPQALRQIRPEVGGRSWSSRP